MIGQIQLLDIANLAEAKSILLENKDSILAIAADADPILQKLGGGPRDLEVRIIRKLANWAISGRCTSFMMSAMQWERMQSTQC